MTARTLSTLAPLLALCLAWPAPGRAQPEGGCVAARDLPSEARLGVGLGEAPTP